MANNYYKPKVWNAFCDSCGFKFKSDQLRLRWDGLMVDDACWEPRQPQDFLRSVIETSNHLPWTRPQDGSGTDAVESPLYVDYNYWDGAAYDPTDPGNIPPGLIYPPVGPNINYTQPGSQPPTVIPPAFTAPTITGNPSNVTINSGDSTTFVASATGVPDPGYQWYKNGVAIPGAIQPFYTVVNASSGDDGAVFYMVASNPAGSAQTTSATLTVISAGVSSGWSVTDYVGGLTWSNGNRTITNLISPGGVRGTLAKNSGKRYIEFYVDDLGTAGGETGIGLLTTPLGSSGSTGPDCTVMQAGGNVYYNNVNNGNYATLATGKVIQIAFDFSTGKVWFGVNNVWTTVANPTGNPNTETSPNFTIPAFIGATLYPIVPTGWYGLSRTVRTSVPEFSYTPPTGFIAWGA